MTTNTRKVLGGRDVVRICIAQISAAYLDREASVRRAVAAIREAAAGGADLVVFPEAWLAGYPYWTEGWDSGLQAWAGGRLRFVDQAVEVPSEATAAIARAARESNVLVVLGCNEMDPRPGVGTIYNSLLLFGRDGTLLGRHRKLMPTFTERMFWGHGHADDVAVFETDIGRIGMLICGENLMTPLRAAMAAQGEDIHIAVFPGAFALHTGPRLEEWNISGDFWGHFVTRAHSFEAGCFTVCACNYLDPADVPADFPYRDRMNIDYARGGSQLVNPLGVPVTGPVEGAKLIHAECHAWMIKAVKCIVDTLGHYARPDVVRVQLNSPDGWRDVGTAYASGALPPVAHDDLSRAADAAGIEPQQMAETLERLRIKVVGDR
jgi:nitrilase